MTVPRHIRDRLPDVWIRCFVCLGRGVQPDTVSSDQPAGACTHCGGTGEVLAPPRRVRR